jgi:AsmA protein
MKASRFLASAAEVLLATVLLLVLLVEVFGWNWLRGPIERMTLAKTGRELVIAGDLDIHLGWQAPRVSARAVTFANPPWASERQMVAAEAVELTLNWRQLLRQKLVVSDMRLLRPVINLEQGAGGRRNWLLDRQQQDEDAQIQIDRLTLDQGTLGYQDALQQTRIQMELSTDRAGAGLSYTAQGQYKGLPVKAQGAAGPVLAMRDAVTPYPISIDASVGRTSLQASGTVTGLLDLAALNMHLKLRGDSLEQLFPLLGIPAPASAAYVTEGQLVHGGNNWRFDEFSGVIGRTDIAGSLQITQGEKRPKLSARLVSRQLDLSDLAPAIGVRSATVAGARVGAAKAPARVLPDLPFQFDRWAALDAEVELQAHTLRRVKELALEDFSGHLSLLDSRLTLDPMIFGLAGGQLSARISLDGRKDPIQAQARIRVSKILLDRLLPGLALKNTSLGQLNGEFDLAGQGNSVAQQLAHANGSARLVVAGGEVSKLLMEKAGLHVWEILQLSVTGDRPVALRCALADFAVKNGRMQVKTLVFDTQVTTLTGAGSIDLAQERLDLTLNQKTKDTSMLALRAPLYLRGSFARPQAGVDIGRVAVRAVGALALSVLNPLLTLLPLIDAGPGQDSDCGPWRRSAAAVK